MATNEARAVSDADGAASVGGVVGLDGGVEHWDGE